MFAQMFLWTGRPGSPPQDSHLSGHEACGFPSHQGPHCPGSVGWEDKSHVVRKEYDPFTKGRRDVVLGNIICVDHRDSRSMKLTASLCVFGGGDFRQPHCSQVGFLDTELAGSDIRVL